MVKRPIKIGSYKRAIQKLCDLSQPQSKVGVLYKSMTPKQRELIRYCIGRLYRKGVSWSAINKHFKCSHTLYRNSIQSMGQRTIDRSRARKEKQAADVVARNNRLEQVYASGFHLILGDTMPSSSDTDQPTYDEYNGYGLDDILISAVNLTPL